MLGLLVLVPVVIGAGLWLGSRDGETPATTRLEATRPTVDRSLRPQVAAGPWDSVAPAVPAEPAVPTAAPPLGVTASAPAVASASPESPAAAPAVTGRGDSVDGGVGGGSNDPARASGAGTGAATSSADASGGAVSAPPAPSAGDGPTTTAPTTTSMPSTQATTTTTTAPLPARTSGRSRHTGAEAEVVPLTNQDRAAAGLGALTRNGCLDSAASGFAEQLARSGVLAHNPGAGAAVAGCRPGASWGDNVGTARPCDTALLESEWMDSPSHRRNILTGAFTLIGVGAWTDEKGACWVQVLFSS